MKITHLDVERYGVWSNLRLDGLADGLNVIYGPNGSGKTTLMQFLRSIFYGFPSKSSDRFLPVVHEGRQGGGVGLASEGSGVADRFMVSRFLDGNSRGSLSVDSNAGQARTFEEILAEVGEPAFRELFTVGYAEADSFDILIREALDERNQRNVESVERAEVEQARQQISNEKYSLLNNTDRSRIRQLAEERERLVEEIQRLRGNLRRPENYRPQEANLRQLDIRIAELEAELLRTPATRQIEHTVQPVHQETRQRLAAEPRSGCQPALPFNSTIASEIAELDQQILKWRRRSRELDEDIVDVKQQLERLHVRDGASKESPRVSQITRTRDCVQQLKQQVRTLESLAGRGSVGSEVEQLRDRVFELCREIGREETERQEESLRSEIVQLRRCQEEMRRQIRILTQRRERLIRNYGVEDREFLRQAVTNVCDCADEQNYIPNGIEPTVSEVRPAIEAPAVEHRTEQVQNEKHVQLTRELQTLRAERDRRASELNQLQSSNVVNDDERRIQALQFDLNIVNENLRQATERWQTLSASDSILQTLHGRYQDAKQPIILVEASEYLARLTNSEYPAIEADQSGRSIVVRRSDGQRLALNGLSRGTRDQVALSLRLAVANAYARRGHRLPMILDDVFLTSDDDRAEAIAMLLRDYAKDGQQIIFFTCSEQHSDLFRSVGVDVRNLPVAESRRIQQPVAEIEPRRSQSFVVRPTVETQSNVQPIQPLLQPPKRVRPVEPPRDSRRLPAVSSDSINTVRPSQDSLVIKAFTADEAEQIVVKPDSDTIRRPVARPIEANVVREYVASPADQSDTADANWIYYLEVNSEIDDLPGIDPDALEQLRSIGVRTIEDLVALVPDAAASRLSNTGISAQQIQSWQSQAMLSCRIPMLRTIDALLLVECRLTNPDQISRMHPEELYAVVERFLSTNDGRRFVRKNNPFDLQTAINWIRWSRHARNLWDSREPRLSREARELQTRPQQRTSVTPRSSASSTSSSAQETYRRTDRKIDDVDRYENDDNFDDDDFDDDGPGGGNGNGHGGNRSRSRIIRRGGARRSSRSNRSGSSRTSSGSARLTTGSQTETTRTPQTSRSSRSSSDRSRSTTRQKKTRTQRSGQSFNREGLLGAQQSVQRQDQTLNSNREDKPLKFYLEKSSPVEDAPSIGPKTAERLAKAGIYTVQDLLAANCDRAAEQIDHKRIKSKTLRVWQSQARLVCQIPELRGHDAQILVACEIEEASKLASMRPNDLFAAVAPFVATPEGERILRNGKKPDLEEINDWISYASQARDLRAA